MHGLSNLGNTCYFNAAIQCLLHVHIISEYIYKNDYNGACGFSKLYQELTRKYFSIHEPMCFDLTPLMDEFRCVFPRFKIHEPHDAQDALFCIIDILEKTFPEIKKLIYGEKHQITISPIGKNTIDIPFSIQTLTVNKSECKVSDLIRESTKWHTLEDYVDDDGNRHNVATTRTLFKTLPKVLFVSFDKKSRIIVEDTLTFNDELKYELQSYVIHRGIQWGGHYISGTKFGEKWVGHDDEHIYETTPSNVDGYYIITYILKSP